VPLRSHCSKSAAAALWVCLLGFGSPLRAQIGDVLTVLPNSAAHRASVRSTPASAPLGQNSVLSPASSLRLPGWAVIAPDARAVWQGRLEQSIDDRLTVFGGYARRGSHGFVGLRLLF
jgi:hypothetical protein